MEEMAKDPAFLFYPGDYLAGTLHLDFECKGAYVDLLMLQFQKDRMTLHMIKYMLGHKFEHIWIHISDKFLTETINNIEYFYNERLRIEKGIRVKYCKSRKDNKSNDKHMYDHMSEHMEDEDINESINNNINIPFDDFWTLYDKKTSPKDVCEKKWRALKDKERSSAMTYIPKYKIAQPDKQYRKDPKSFIHQKAWTNELIYKNGTHNGSASKNGKSTGLHQVIASLKTDLESGT